MKNNKTKVITIAALIIAVIALSIGFAAFASTLNISTSASVTPTNTFSVKFASSVTGANGEFTEFQVTPSTPVYKVASGDATPGTPEIDNTDVKNPSIGNLSAAFTQPGQSVTYTFYVVNDGTFDAFLTNVVFNNATGTSSFRDCVSDSLSSNPATQSLVDSVCSNISFTMSVGDDSNITSSRTLTNHLLTRNHYETVIVTIAYTGSSYADGAFKVNFGDIDLNYRTIDEVEEVPTPAPSEVVADNLIPTPAQLAARSEYEHDDKDGLDYYYYMLSESDLILYTEEGTAKYVQIGIGDNQYIYLCNEDAVTLLAQDESNLSAFKWYIGEDHDEYNSQNPLSNISLDGLSQDAKEYVNRVIASFGN